MTLKVNNSCEGMCYNGTYYCLVHAFPNCITVIDTHGRHVREIAIKEAFGQKIRFGEDIHMDSTSHNIYVPNTAINNLGVLCVSVEGGPLWFCPLIEKAMGITEICGVVAYSSGRGVHLVSKTGEYKKKLLGEDDTPGNLQYIVYCENRMNLYFNLNSYAIQEI